MTTMPAQRTKSCETVAVLEHLTSRSDCGGGASSGEPACANRKHSRRSIPNTAKFSRPLVLPGMLDIGGDQLGTRLEDDQNRESTNELQELTRAEGVAMRRLSPQNDHPNHTCRRHSAGGPGKLGMMLAVLPVNLLPAARPVSGARSTRRRDRLALV